MDSVSCLKGVTSLKVINSDWFWSSLVNILCNTGKRYQLLFWLPQLFAQIQALLSLHSCRKADAMSGFYGRWWLYVEVVKKVLDLEWHYDDWYEVEYIPRCVWHVQYILRNYFLVMVGAHKMILVAKVIFPLVLCRSRKFFSVWKHFIMPWM